MRKELGKGKLGKGKRWGKEEERGERRKNEGVRTAGNKILISRPTNLRSQIDSPHAFDAVEVGDGRVSEEIPLERLGEDGAVAAGRVELAEVETAGIRHVDEDQLLRHVQDRVESAERRRKISRDDGGGNSYRPMSPSTDGHDLL